MLGHIKLFVFYLQLHVCLCFGRCQADIILFRAFLTLCNHLETSGWWYVSSWRRSSHAPLIQGAPSLVYEWNGRLLFVLKSCKKKTGALLYGESLENPCIKLHLWMTNKVGGTRHCLPSRSLS